MASDSAVVPQTAIPLMMSSGDIGEVLVARFDQVQQAGGRGSSLLPDFSAVQAPLRMLVTPPDRSSRSAAAEGDALALQDASGKHSFVAERSGGDSNYSTCASVSSKLSLSFTCAG